MRQTRLRPISKKRQELMPLYNRLIRTLRKLCDNKSELSRENPDWQSGGIVDPHHINGRNGDHFINPFEIIMLTRMEHDREEGKIKGEQPIGKEKLLAIVRKLRLEQGFSE